jgi:cold shock CspA family protein
MSVYLSPHSHSMTGTIKKLVAAKGFGFIVAEGLPKDLFFHSETLDGVAFAELREGDAVAFTAEDVSQHILAKRVSPDAAKKLQECNAELVAYLTKHPEAMADLHPGTFENIVAEIFRQEGFATERISRWNESDGGVDLIAVRHLSPGYDLRIAIQCKTTHGQKISAEPIRSLHGVLDLRKAHAGVVVTTGLFTEQAKEEAAGMWKISLRNYNDILASAGRLNLPSNVASTLAAFLVTRC